MEQSANDKVPTDVNAKYKSVDSKTSPKSDAKKQEMGFLADYVVSPFGGL